jgi:hypothetical protein
VSNLAARTLGPVPSPSTADYLGPAEVVAVDAARVHVELPGGPVVRAEMALALPYHPVVGDLLLVIGKGGESYVIGVLHGAGRTALTLQGDVDLHAANGKLRLSGDQGLELRGPEIDVQCSKLSMIAGAALQRFSSLCQRVTDLWSTHAGEAHTVVDGGSLTQAKTAAVLTEGVMTINGKEVHLG